jgi:hypothetical protein
MSTLLSTLVQNGYFLWKTTAGRPPRRVAGWRPQKSAAAALAEHQRVREKLEFLAQLVGYKSFVRKM